ncbi:GtrA family protein [Aciduricibacillus chroicocephali]|uniref:GtrA family protein n=1 Tax=Aciduricibacillus chroicocephali TaxID=3054939 RepID=A0ABY9KTB5_9BACI|nr:GtrA family protein [Bacillaceae bacterium 44XB]
MRLFQHEFFKFVVVGCINTATYYALYLILLNIFGVYYFAAHIIAFAISLVVSFFLNTHYTYGVKPTWSKFIRYPLTQAANTVITSALLYLFVDMLGLNASLAPIAALFFTVPITFFMTGKILKVS